MTAPVSSNPSSTKSRRALLAGALGAAAATAVGAVARVDRVRAADGDIMHVGQFHAATGTTSISSSTDNTTLFLTNDAGLGLDVQGAQVAVKGTSGGKTGLMGVAAGGFAHPAPRNQTGVFGFAGTGAALYGRSVTGHALHTSGRVKLDKVSAVATIAAGRTRVVVDPGVNITAGSFVLLTPKANIGPRALWFTTNATANTFTIRMSSARSSGTKVAWLLLG